ncbi:hypothetical protein KMW28_27485 [Flammeovirga yaeyamensis]|uniref:Secreted protein n=1 Tax=Flammeovirga yaeyamensis TaxID=367791 RepID=A0AAX1NAZ9_9BACT|nr:hypothetical protein [Flammeovirga yaeyamensis]MBB3699973.1 hypothetical protein [Flammeovirga yaeyamensis]NMF37588.1 hypothetical protein [Flammeovirga yaeyamensis]QWG04645.1 hypothetical protein KMW28_27485 [Flammeovirga yaeyamensis]
MKTAKLHQLFHLVCAGVILFNAFSLSLLKIDLEIQRDFIEKVFCINKDKPKMSCHGQCFINKEMKKEAQKQEEANTVTTKEVVLSMAEKECLVPDFSPEKPLLVKEKVRKSTPQLTSKDVVDRLLKPPIA